MARALQLAALGGRAVQPNPMVGCVLVQEGRMIAEGWHPCFGAPHAEVLALQGVSDKKLLQGATAYVSLEPCAHQGKTPPCTEALIEAGIGRVVVACEDPNPLVQGRGIARLRAAGLKVELGPLTTEARWLNRRFFTYMSEKRPYVLLKWAQSSDGFLAPRGAVGIHWISNPQSRRLVHLWRSQEAAMLVGYRTALQDDPQLSLRWVKGTQPLRIVLDQEATLPRTLRLWDDRAPTLAYTTAGDQKAPYLCLEQPFLQQLLSDLHKRKVLSLMVEGGAATLSAFLKKGLWDEARIISSSYPLRAGLAAPQMPAGTYLRQQAHICGDKLRTYLPKSPTGHRSMV